MTERLLKLVGPAHIAGGLLLFATGFVPEAQCFLESFVSGADDSIWSAFFASVLGPTIASWGVLFAALVNQFYSAPSTGLWRAMILSVVIWAPLDTALCLKYGIYSGAIVNTIITIVLVWLLVAAKRSIR